MSFYLNFSHVYFSYESAAGPLFENLTISFPTAWTGIAGANGSGKSTLLKLASGALQADNGQIIRKGLSCFCEQETEQIPKGAVDFLDSYQSLARQLRQDLKIDSSMLEHWNYLSLGERKKIQIGMALYQQPDILCLDEPTNHLDNSSRNTLFKALEKFGGIGLLVSHDRELLDALCHQCLFIRPWGIKLRSGGITFGSLEEQQELKHNQEEIAHLKKELQRSKKELQRRREKAQKAANKDSKRKLSNKDHDAKGRIDAARVSGRDRRANDLAGSQVKTVTRYQEAIQSHSIIKTTDFGLKIPYGKYSTRNRLLELSSTIIPLGDRQLKIPDLSIGSHDRIALTGDNGAGKTTLLKKLLFKLNISSENLLYMPQELDDSLKQSIYRQLTELDRNSYSQVMNVVASLGSIPERILNSDRCSPGEWRKLFFGLGVLRDINLIIMDEPTNHLDLPSIECLEAALTECQCAMLLVSHDMIFLRRTCSANWHIDNGIMRCSQFPHT